MIINIPLEIPDEVAAIWGYEMYWRIKAGWTPTIFVTDEETGITDEIENPMTPFEASIAFKQKQTREEFRDVLLQMGREAGEKQALEQFNSLFPI